MLGESCTSCGVGYSLGDGCSLCLVCAFNTTQEQLQRLAEIGKQIRNQDNACTSDALFTVQQKRRIWGIDTDYTENVAWVDGCNDYYEIYPGKPQDDCPTFEELEQLDDDDKVPDQYTRTGYIDVWEFVTACFTRQACEEFIARNRHKLNDPRVYVESGYRNEEWLLMREVLSGFHPKPPPAPAPEAPPTTEPAPVSASSGAGSTELPASGAREDLVADSVMGERFGGES